MHTSSTMLTLVWLKCETQENLSVSAATTVYTHFQHSNFTWKLLFSNGSSIDRNVSHFTRNTQSCMTFNLSHMHVRAWACVSLFFSHSHTIRLSLVWIWKAHAIGAWTRSFLLKPITFNPQKIHNKWMASSVCVCLRVVYTICISFARSSTKDKKHYIYHIRRIQALIKSKTSWTRKFSVQKYGVHCVRLFESNLCVGVHSCSLFRARMLFSLYVQSF